MAFKHILMREIKAFIKNPAFILMIVLMVVFYGGLGQLFSHASQEAVKEALTQNIGIILLDENDLAKEILIYANKTLGGRIFCVSNMSDALNKYGIVIIIPENFTESLLSNKTFVISFNSTVAIDRFSLTASAKTAILEIFINTIQDAYRNIIISKYGLDPSLLNKKLTSNTIVKIGENYLSMGEFNTIASIGMSFLMILAIVIAINASNAVNFMAIEKVEKAFELLLAQPIPRRTIVLGKLVASVIASIIMGGAYIIGLLLMIGGMSSEFPATSTSVSEPNSGVNALIQLIGTNGIILMAVSLVLGLIYTGALGIILGSLVSDQRMAGVMVAPVMFLFMGLAFTSFIMGLELNTITSIWVGATIVNLPIYIVYALMSGSYELILVAYGSAAICTITLIGLAVWIFNKDIVVLGLRFEKKSLLGRK
ncbi:MAG: ABC transporter permease [Staphylothermus sp.]|nr:ABC transporter permease [Staphylothermus sp.]